MSESYIFLVGNLNISELLDGKYEDKTGTKYKQEWRTQERLDGVKVKVRVNTGVIDFRPSNSSYFIGHASYGEIKLVSKNSTRRREALP